MNRNFTNGVVGWAFCNYQDPANLSGGNPSKSVMLPAIQAASRIFQQDGGCAASS